MMWIKIKLTEDQCKALNLLPSRGVYYNRDAECFILFKKFVRFSQNRINDSSVGIKYGILS